MSEKLIAIVGPTASGKTNLSLQIAQRYSGEIIAADSRTVYRGMDIGTAKPSEEERAKIPHFGLDVVDPDQKYSASEFQKYAQKCIDSIRKRGNLPIIVGGTGLYIDAVLYNYQFPPEADPKLRAELEKKPLNELVQLLKDTDAEAYRRVDLKNQRRIVRAIEIAGWPKTMTTKLPPNYLIVGINPGLPQLYKNIAQRTENMLDGGLVDEVSRLVDLYGRDAEPLNSPGYSEIIEYLNGQISLSEAEGQINIRTQQLAKRQMTWFKRNKDIHWAENSHQALEICHKFLKGTL